VCREFGDFNAIGLGNTAEFVAIILAGCCFVEIEQAGIPAGYLYALIAAVGGPASNAVPAVERRLIACKLRQLN